MFQEDKGLLFKGLCIDPHKVPKHEKVFLSHAHSDHVKLSKKSEFFATKETIDLVRKRYGDANFTQVELNKKKKFDDFELELLPNGHILGSAQAMLSSDGKDFVFTSDFRLQDSLFFKGIEPIKSETLVLETTFGSPQYVFPKQSEVTSEMISWVSDKAKKGLVVLSGYSLGKAQELTKIANEAGFTPIVHDSIFELNEIYKKHGVNVGDYTKLDHNLKDSSVLIMPPQLVDRHLFATLEHFDKRKFFSALATGWTHRGAFDKTFPLSNHADFNDLIEYVKLTNPKLILTDHGFCEEFARKLNKLGFNAKPLKQYKQKSLSEF
ncbi:MAG: MBL fold metallo-hydrolase [archaeon]|jgi:Cft2 family RNA processing exonuclease